MKNILKIKKMGMDIYEGADLITDLSNFRYYINLNQDNVKEEFKQAYTINTIEIMRGYKREIKNGKIKNIASNMLSINIYKYDKDGNCFGDLNLSKIMESNDKRFNKKDLLDAINKIVINKYTDIEEI